MDAGAPTSRERAARYALWAAIAMMVVWGVNFTITKQVLAAIGVSSFLFLRFLIMPALAFVLLAIAFRRNPRAALPRREDIPRFAACGLVGHTFHVGIVTWGIDLSTAFSSALVLTSGPLFTLLILTVLGTEKLRGRQVAGTLFAFAGIVLFLSDKFVAGFSRAGMGDLVLLFASLLFSVYTVVARPLTDRYGPMLVLAWTLAFGAPPMLLATLPGFLATSFEATTPGLWLAFTWAVLMSSFLGWLVWTWVNAVRGVARSAPLMYLMPPIAGVAAWLTLGETFTPLKLAGATITLAGVAWAQFGGGHAPPKETAQADSG
jgi:drug/metabolite transporter (DMT)-like permease